MASDWRTLDACTARALGAGSPEDVIQRVCEGCVFGNLDFATFDFCPTQVAYGFDGEAKAIQYRRHPDGSAEVRCAEWEGEQR